MNYSKIFKKINFNRLTVWQILVVAFLFLFGVVLFLSVSFYVRLEKELSNSVEGVFSTININTDLLEKTLKIIEERKKTFDKIILEKSAVRDPSL